MKTYCGKTQLTCRYLDRQNGDRESGWVDIRSTISGSNVHEPVY